MDNQTTAPQTPADRAQAVSQDTKEAASTVASTAGDEARRTTREAKDQARQLWGQTRSDLTEQASAQQSRAASGLRELAGQLRSMADQADDDGMARGLVDDVARRAGDAAAWLEQRDPGSLLDEARSFARRRPMAFLAGAAGLGVVAGRLSRSLMDEARESSAESPGSADPAGADVASTGTPQFAAVGTTPVVTESTAPTTTATGDLPGLHRTTQPIEPDGTPTPIDAEGRLTVGDELGGAGR